MVCSNLDIDPRYKKNRHGGRRSEKIQAWRLASRASRARKLVEGHREGLDSAQEEGAFVFRLRRGIL
jgi:hypothetical protein